MVRLSILVSFLLGLAVPSSATSAPLAKEAEVDGIRLSFVEQGSGEPVIFVHGSMSDLRVWDAVRERISGKYRFVAYTQRYHGLDPWKDDGRAFSTATHADDLAKFIRSLDAGPVHLVGWSGGGAVATAAALDNPSLARSLVLYEPFTTAMLPESPEGKAAREERAKAMAPVIAAIRAPTNGWSRLARERTSSCWRRTGCSFSRRSNSSSIGHV
jgi:pimeloyl-ACP methyl ester carboxylesterase